MYHLPYSNQSEYALCGAPMDDTFDSVTRNNWSSDCCSECKIELALQPVPAELMCGALDNE